MPMSASSRSIRAWRSLVAVGSGARVGPTGRPMITMPPLSEEGYWSLNRCQSRVILYCSSRARPFAGDAGVEQLRAQGRADRDGGGIGTEAAERHTEQHELDAGEQREVRPQRQRHA